MNRLLLLVVLAWSSPLYACDTGAAALDLHRAEALLSDTVLQLSNTQSKPLNQAEITCVLNNKQSLYAGLESALPDIQSWFETSQRPDLSTRDKRDLIEQINRAVTRDAGTGFVQLPSTQNAVLSIDLYQLLARHCTDEPNTTCGQASALSQHLWQLSGQLRGIASTLNQKDVADSLTYQTKLDQQWRAYKDQTIKLWPHEVLLNSLIYQPKASGFSTPPAYKIMTLRPAIGLSYLSEADHRIQPTLNVDLLGVYWWKYQFSDRVSATPGRGIAASMVWDGSDVAYGLSYHASPQWSATIARGDDNDVVVSLSFQLAYWLFR
ncbi:hypothetical protein GCM10008090_12070 [Arenicella chitinivorans]|uniref:Uncharacterized protein n=1 Tax=Arenicella chitinivorans TaxID=1329800 RepID=A0A918VKU7_9GAMM|nr:hypothetical protein [Arenicella chitinivorans]GHA04320.1 hypothetical protein GCM10008090_12070 [Arenicella chitinivorans]